MYTTIYCLYKNDIPFYVGKSNNPKNRKYQHQIIYGKDIIMENLDYVLKTEWKEWEKWWISLFRSWGFDLVNQNNGGGGCVGNIERNIKSNMWKTIPIVMWDKNLNPIKVWRGRKEAAEWLGITPLSIGNVLNGKCHQSCGYLWSYIGNKPKIYPHKKSIPVIQHDKKMNKVKEWESAKNAGKSLNINYKSIWNNLNNINKSAGGYIWKYK